MESAPAPTAEPEKKSLFETIVVSTPVILTVVATFILGRSTSEMTQAQYQRAVAGQKQSKVADEWAFFQAKRIRGTDYETTAAVLLAQKADAFTGDTLLDTAQGLVREIQLTDKDSPTLRDALQPLDKKAKASLAQVTDALNPPKDGLKLKRLTLTPENVKSALAALDVYPAPSNDVDESGDSIDGEQRKLLEEVLDDIRKFKPEKDVAPKTLNLKPETIDAAMERAKTRAAKVSAHGKAIDRVLSEFDVLVDRQAALCREYQRLIAARLSALAANGKDGEFGARLEIFNLEKRLDRVRTMSARLVGDYKAARYAFDARRYEDDARSNQDAAFIYDVHVYQSSARSDKHLRRSFGFMIAMLVAQVGVTIGSLAIMLRFRLPVWLVAALSGIGAIAFAAYVFLELGPLLW
ncbi:MAG TPA: DUF4337 family protein [Gemmataceae bacterium]|nr:DUF4337 family protein [Gemmataceae bacterium]